MTVPRASAAVLAGCLAAAGGWLAFAGQPPAAPDKAPAEDRPADRAAVRQALDGFAAAFRKGDAKAVAALWTAEGEYIGDDGASFRGRPALEKAYADLFAKGAGDGLEAEVDSVRFPSRDTAVVEGHFKLRKAKSGELVVSRCSLLFAREDGAWRLAIVREWPGDGLSLRDLDWLIGSWESKGDGRVVRTRYEWAPNKSFIRCQFSVTEDGQTQGGTQMIGKDPATGLLRAWTFEDAGGVGEADITRDGKKWVHAARGATGDGRALTATNLLTPAGADAFTWQSVERTLDGERLPDLPPVKVVRAKDQK